MTDKYSTINYYNKNFKSYIKKTFSIDMKKQRECFLKYLPSPAKILDAGCGSGRDALAFAKKGYTILGLDAAEKMVKYVNEELKIPAIQGFFQEMEFSEEFDGIWASASLVHISLDELPDILKKFWKALKPKGILLLSFKEGAGTKTEGKRTFTYMNKKTLSLYLDDFIVLEQWIHSPKKRADFKTCYWLNTLVRKKSRL